MIRSSLVLCLFTMVACATSNPTEPSVLTEQVEGGTASSHLTSSGIETTLTAPDGLAGLSWDLRAGTAQLQINGASQTVTMESDLTPSLHAANAAISSLWADYLQSTSSAHVTDTDPDLLGCGCHWDSGACGGGAVSCCCFWSDLCNTACTN